MGGVSADPGQDAQEVLDHPRRGAHHLQDVAQPGQQAHPQQALKRPDREDTERSDDLDGFTAAETSTALLFIARDTEPFCEVRGLHYIYI